MVYIWIFGLRISWVWGMVETNGKLGREVMSGVFEGMIDELGNKEVVVKKMDWG